MQAEPRKATYQSDPAPALGPDDNAAATSIVIPVTM
jgi:hypothetical protein